METKFVKSDSFSAERAGLIKLSIKTVETFGKNVIILIEIQGVFENIAIEFERNSEIMFQLFFIEIQILMFTSITLKYLQRPTS